MRITLAETNWPAGGFTGAAGDGPINGYKYGETEDYLLDYEADQAFDWGDAPPVYATLAANNGPRHQLVPGFLLGPAVDTEADGQPGPAADGDDNNGTPDDEDGVIFTTPLVRGSNACVTVALGSGPAGGRLDGWVDFDGDGNWWTTAAEQIFANQALVSGMNTNLCFFVPTTAQLGATYARFRLSSAGGLLPSGAAVDGEVEDYLVKIAQRRPATNVVITQIAVTNLTSPPAQAVTLYWNAEAGISYQVQATVALTNGANAWTNVSPLILGPLNSFTETNAVATQRYYRVAVPFTYP